MKFHWILLLVVLTLPVAVPQSAAAQGTLMTWTIEGIKREALVFPPTEKGKSPSPLVFAFHGHGGNMNGAQAGMGLQNLWPQAIVVYPQGLPTPSHVDPQGLKSGWQTEAGQEGDRDLKLFDAMLATLRQKYSVDERRIYATGFSNGAIFSYLLWAERGKPLAAFGICAGRLLPSDHLTEPRAILIIGGRNDHTLPFAYQQEAIETARGINNATGPGHPCGGPFCTFYRSTTHTPVVTRLHPGGHVFPPWAGRAIVLFFKTHSL